MRKIDADALAKRNCGACPENSDNCTDSSCYYYELRRRIASAPTIEAEPVRHGHWMFLEQKSDYLWKCSNCKGNFDQRFSYCPNCGARMDEGADNG